MWLEIILALLIGIIAGTFTGLAPGIHINLIAAILLASLSSFSNAPSIALAVFIVSMSITHTFIDFIPSIFLGAPDEDTFLSILPGHEMLKLGHGYQASILTLFGSLSALLIIIVFTPLFVLFLPALFNSVKAIIPFLLIFLSFYLIFREKNIYLSLSVFLMAGFLGFASFNLPIKEPLLPILTGLFGISSIITSLRSKMPLKKQIITPLRKIMLSKSHFLKSFLSSAIVAPLCSFLPGIGSGHASTIASELIPHDRKGFLFLNGAINTIIMALSFVTIFAIGRARSGSAAAIQAILQNINLHHVIILISTIILAGIISFFIGVKLSKIFALFLNRINYSKFSIGVIVILLIVNIVFTNWLGILVLISSTALGIFCILSGSRRINLMAALIVPSIIYFLIQ